MISDVPNSLLVSDFTPVGLAFIQKLGTGRLTKIGVRRDRRVVECTFFGKEARFHHIGLAVQSIQELSPSSEVVVEKTQGVSLAFIQFHGVRIELLEPLDDRSPIARSLRDGVKLLHLCFEVPDLEKALKLCRAAGFHRLSRPVPAPVFDNRRMVWVFSKQYGLFELVERNHSAPVGAEATSG